MKELAVKDPVVEAYKQHVDRTLLRENLKLSPAQRLEKFVRFAAFAGSLREAGLQARAAVRNKKLP
jgi:hypothetical protein